MNEQPDSFQGFRALGEKVGSIGGTLDTFPKPETVYKVEIVCDEVTAVCPVTEQPDQYVVKIEYIPKKLCVESKSLKLYLQQFRNEGIFVEALSARIARDLQLALNSYRTTVYITQKSRGGISITASATTSSDSKEELTHDFPD